LPSEKQLKSAGLDHLEKLFDQLIEATMAPFDRSSRQALRQDLVALKQTLFCRLETLTS